MKVIVALTLLLGICSGIVQSLDLSKAKGLINDMANLIHHRFEFNRSDTYQFFLEASNLPPYSWDLQKYKIAKKIAEGNSARFTMIFGGSSVTAGHDNYYSQSHPFVFERRIAPILEALGVKLVVRNIAQGANNCRPFDYCYAAMGGEEADFIAWEQSFNCGKDRTIFEYMARYAYWHNAVIYYIASGGWMPTACPPSEDAVPRISEDWTPEKSGITEKIPSLSAESVAAYKLLMEQWNGDGNSCSKFSSYYGGLYKAVGPWGFNMWAHSSTLCNSGKGCDAVNVIGQCAASGGPKWITQDAAYYAGEKNKKGKSWHPTSGMHLVRGETLAFNYVQIIADAVFMLEADLKTMTAEEAAKSYQAKLDVLREAIPERGLYTPGDEGAAPAHCFTNYEPHFNPAARLDSIVMGAHEGWKKVDGREAQSWGAGEDKYGYKDTKPFYEALGSDKALHVRVADVRYGAIRVCGHSRKDSMAHPLFELDPDYAFSDTKPDETGKVSLPEYTRTEKSYVLTDVAQAGDECVKITGVPVGTHVLTIKTDPAHPTHISTVSHVIVF